MIDATRRADDTRRRAAAEIFKEKERHGAMFWVAARFLEKSDREWRLVYDRLTLPTGAVLGRAEPDGFYTASGRRLEVADGKLEKNIADPAAAELNRVLAAWHARESLDADGHRAALEALVSAYEKLKGSTEGAEALRLFALAHASALGKEAAGADRLGFVFVDDRWGAPDQALHYALARGFAAPASVDAARLRQAEGSAASGVRYVAMLIQVQRALAGEGDPKAAYLAIRQTPAIFSAKSIEEHLKALGQSYRAVVHCKQCKDGKVKCANCRGRGTADRPCDTCKGEGYVPTPNKADDEDVRVKCRTCDGKKVFRAAECRSCSKSGIVTCEDCLGWPWGDRPCTDRNCRSGRVPCEACEGAGRVEKTCATCGGTGRTPAAGDRGGGAYQKCRGCDGRGVYPELQDCKDCGPGRGFISCGRCKGGKEKPKRATHDAAGVFTLEPCSACDQKGWPMAGLAIPCPRCVGLGQRIKPVAAPDKVVGE